jgi:16S rRNA (guanine966-N2)-methyltransferase
VSGTPAHEVRIIGGQWKRSKLPVADKPGLRPTPDRVRETLFNWLGHDLSGWRCLDAFAGSGALGFEAASRGAAEVLLLERDPELVHILQTAKQRLRGTSLRIERAEAIAWMTRARGDSFDLTFIDPPFDSALAECALPLATQLMAAHGLIYLESRHAMAAAPEGWRVHRQGRAGAVHFHLLCRANESYTAAQGSSARRGEPSLDHRHTAHRRLPRHLRSHDPWP